jgi:streptogramin lyase
MGVAVLRLAAEAIEFAAMDIFDIEKREGFMRRGLLLVCLVSVIGLAVWGLPAEITTWQLAADSFPANLRWMSDGNLYVSLQNPRGIALFEPAANRLGVWETAEAPGEFELINSRIFFAQPHVGELGWLNLDFGMMAFYSIPSASAWPVMLLDGGAAPGDVDIWYVDWSNGNVGLFAPIESGPFDHRDLVPNNITATRASYGVEPSVQQVAGTTHFADPSLVPAVASAISVKNDPFTEWALFSPAAPTFGFTRSDDGRIWVSGAAGDPLQALSPWDDTVTLYDLPGDPFVMGLAAASGNRLWYLATTPNESAVTLGVLNVITGDATVWTIPDAGDPLSLRVVGDKVWFTDRWISAIYRFDPATSSFTWWLSGADDAPMALEPGVDGEMWISYERTGAIARLVFE